MTNPDDPRSLLAAAVERTTHGSAQVTVRTLGSGDFGEDRGEVPEDLVLELRGVVDFPSERCRLDGDERLVLAGPATYAALDDGRWTCREGRRGTWDVLHPRGVLESLRKACRTVTGLDDKRFTVELDREALNGIINPRVASAWAVNASVALDDEGRVTGASLRLTEPEAAAELIFELGDFGPPVSIELPPADATISLDDHLDELLRRPESG